jgi:hypothetical protein
MAWFPLLSWTPPGSASVAGCAACKPDAYTAFIAGFLLSGTRG